MMRMRMRDDRCSAAYSIMGWDWICASLRLAIPLWRRILSGLVWIAGHWRNGKRSMYDFS